MGKYYKPPPETGKEYVLAADKFVDVTKFRCERLPKEWKDYTLDPLVADAIEIRRLVHVANKIYMNTANRSNQELYDGVSARISLLEQALRQFEAYDTEFDSLMDKVDLAGYEAKRLENIILKIISDENVKHGGEPIQLTCKMGINDIQYETASGVKAQKLLLTHKNVMHWISVRRDAERLIRSKLQHDIAYRKNLEKALSG